jgi:DNA-binding NarL/FixJ family response regulator
MNKRMVSALIITRSVDLEHGLVALLESIPGLSTVKVIQELTLAFDWIESNQPAIVLLDLDISGRDPRDFLEKIRAVSAETKRVLLVNDLQDVNWVLQYAEAVLLKGVAPASVVAIINNLLSTKGEENEYIRSND